MNTHLTESQIKVEKNHPNAYNFKRSFGGKLSDFSSPEERNFYKAMLNAYLKGATTFNFGYHSEQNGMRVRTTFKVNIDNHLS